jgi:transcriptional regulator with XRE-family HTH domain
MNQTDLSFWRKTLSSAKATLKAKGEISGDATIAATVSDELEEIGEEGIQRTTINHWLSGKRLPNIAQFIALCRALKVSPADAIGAQAKHPTPGPHVAQTRAAAYLDADAVELSRFFDKLQRADPKVRKPAMAAAAAVIDSQEPQTGIRKGKQH